MNLTSFVGRAMFFKTWIHHFGGISLVFLLCVVMVSADSKPKSEFDGIITVMARKYRVPSDLIHAIIRAESNYDSRAVSIKGAMGLMQLMPGTAKQYGVKDVFSPVQNIEGGVRYLKDLIRLYNGNTNLVLAAYNAGQVAVQKYGGIPPYRETINYIEKIKTQYDKPKIRSTNSTKIYKYVDEKGRTVFTNDYNLYKRYTKKGKSSESKSP